MDETSLEPVGSKAGARSSVQNREIEDGGLMFEVKIQYFRKKNTDRLEFFCR